MSPTIMVMKRVMVACVTTEVVKITQPAKDIRTDRVHLLNFIKAASNGDKAEKDREQFYRAVYNKVVEVLNGEKQEIYEHFNVRSFNFDDCFHAIYDILITEKRKGSDIYVNISGGTPEYAAAASIASMMIPGVKLFSVGTKATGHTIDFDKQLSMAYHNGELVGSAFEVHKPISINSFPLKAPDEDVLKCLKIFNSLPIGKRSNVNVIRRLIHNQLWKFALDEKGSGTSVELENEDGEMLPSSDREKYLKLQRKEAVLYQRDYINKWKADGWIEKSKINGKRYQLTDTGKRYVDIFCSDVVFIPTD